MSHKHLNSVIPKLPSRNLSVTKTFYTENLNFKQVGGDYPDYLMLMRDEVELHFFLHRDLDVLQNYGMCYLRVSGIEQLFETLRKLDLHFPGSGMLERKPWGLKEFSIIDNDHNLLTFGESIA